MKYFKRLYEQQISSTDDIWTAEYKEWKFDEKGITNLSDEDSNYPKFIVLFDMHS